LPYVDKRVRMLEAGERKAPLQGTTALHPSRYT
jgi:hypothetical protein